ncbi:MAG: TonB-dependent receptor [Myxococcota bacterium]
MLSPAIAFSQRTVPDEVEESPDTEGSPDASNPPADGGEVDEPPPESDAPESEGRPNEGEDGEAVSTDEVAPADGAGSEGAPADGSDADEAGSEGAPADEAGSDGAPADGPEAAGSGEHENEAGEQGADGAVDDDDWGDDEGGYGASIGGDEAGEADVEADADVVADEATELGATAVFVRDPLRVGGSVQNIGDEELQALEYDDPHAILLQVPGVYVRGEDGFGLRPNIGLRGGNPERSRRVTLMEDGVLFGPAPYAAPAAYYFPLMTRAVGVDVYKGPAALLYGPQTVGGALDLRMRNVPTRSTGQVDLAYGLFNARKLHIHYGTSNRWGGFVFEALDVASDGFKDIDGSSRNTGFWRTDFMTRGFLQTNPSAHTFHRFELKLGMGRERSDETYLGLTDEDLNADPTRRYAASEDDRMRWWRTQVQLTWRMDVGDNFEMVTDVYRHDFDRSWDRLAGFDGGSSDLLSILRAPTGVRAVSYDVLRGVEDSDVDARTRLLRTDNQRRFVSQGIQTRARGRFRTGVARHEVEFGARFHFDQVRREHVFRLQDMVSGSLVDIPDSEFQGTNNRGRAYATSAYLVYGLQAFGFDVRPGIRTEIIRTSLRAGGSTDSETRAIALPGIGLTYAITPTLSALAGVHRGFSPVAPGQPEEVEPETSVSYEFGARYLKGTNRLEVVGFVNDYGNLQGQCSFATGCTEDMLDMQFNGGEVLVWGVEVGGAWDFDLPAGFKLPVRLTYTYTGTSFQSSFDSEDPTFGTVEEGDELPYIPEHQGQLQLGLDHPMGGFRAVANFVGEMREQAGSGEPRPNEVTDRYATVDVVGYAQATRRIRVYGRLDNLTNAQPIVSRRPFGARSIRPFSFQIGIKLDL